MNGLVLGNFPQSVNRLIQKAIETVTSNLPSERNPQTISQFLTRISNQNPLAIKRQIENYLDNSMFASGYGLLYLAAMITNSGKNVESLSRFERNRLGSIPPIKQVRKK